MKPIKTIAVLMFLLGISVLISARDKIYQPEIILPADISEFLDAKKWHEAVEMLIKLNEDRGPIKSVEHKIVLCYQQMAIEALNKKNYRKAIDQIEYTLEYRDDVAELQMLKGICYFRLAQYGNAEKTLLHALELNTSAQKEAHTMLGEIYYRSGRMELAQEHFQLGGGSIETFNKKRLTQVDKQKNATEDMEKFDNESFSIRFDGKKMPGLIKLVAGILNDARAKVGKKLGMFPRRKIPVILLSKVQFFDITGSPKWVGGIYEGQIKIPVENYLPWDLRNILTHEYVHVVLHDNLSGNCPWWLDEGLAQYFSGDIRGNRKKLKLAKKYFRKKRKNDIQLIRIRTEIQDMEVKTVKLHYALALSFINYFIDNEGIKKLHHILKEMANGKDISTAFKNITGFLFTEYQSRWTK